CTKNRVEMEVFPLRPLRISAFSALMGLSTQRAAEIRRGRRENKSDLPLFVQSRAAFVLDCVGVNATLAEGVAALSWRGRLVMVGAGGGSIPFDFFKMPPGAQFVTSLNGGGVALKEVIDMAALGRIKSLEDRYPLSAVKQAYEDFEQGHLTGRAVVIPDGT